MIAVLMTLLACSDVTKPGSIDDHVHGVIESVTLTFSPQSGGADVASEYHDGEADPITLAAGEVYDLSVAFGDHDHDSTGEIEADAEEHQIFFLGEGVDSEATGTTGGMLSIAYADSDDNGLPLGLWAEAEATAAGEVTLGVVLRHLPPENDVALKVDGLAETVASDGLAAIGGESDVDVDFFVEITE